MFKLFYLPFSAYSSSGFPCSATIQLDRTTILSAPATVLILWAITRTVLSLINLDNALWISVSFSTSKLAVASSSKIIGTSFKNALAIEILWRSPPDDSQPFSQIF